MSFKLQPSWLGNINWSHGLPLLPENNKLKQSPIVDYWGNFQSPVWDYMYEYRKSFSKNNYNTFDNWNNNYKENINENLSENQFITISKNKKNTLSSRQLIKFSKNYCNNTSGNAGNNFDIESDASIADIEDVEYIIDDDDDINMKTNYELQDTNI